MLLKQKRILVQIAPGSIAKDFCKDFMQQVGMLLNKTQMKELQSPRALNIPIRTTGWTICGNVTNHQSRIIFGQLCQKLLALAINTGDLSMSGQL